MRRNKLRLLKVMLSCAIVFFIATPLAPLAFQATSIVAGPNASGWQIEIVDSAGGVYTSLALDGDGYPHISYCHSDDLRYAYQDAYGWHVEIVDSEGSCDDSTSLALDQDGYPHVSYYDDTNNDLKYAYQDTSGWHIETVDSDGRDTSLALDGDGYPHISYHGSDDLKYAYQDAYSWHIETVDSEGDVG